MKTKYLDSEIQRMTVLEKQGSLSVFGRESLIEYRAIKEALTIFDVSNRRELLIAFGKKLQKNTTIFLSTEHLEQEVDSFESNL